MQGDEIGVKNARVTSVLRIKTILSMLLISILFPLDFRLNGELESILLANIYNFIIISILFFFPRVNFLHYWILRGIIWIVIFMLSISILGGMPSLNDQDDEPQWFFVIYISLYVIWLFLYDKFYFSRVFRKI